MFRFVSKMIRDCFSWIRDIIERLLLMILTPFLVTALPWLVILWLIDLGVQEQKNKIKREKEEVEKTPPIQLN